MSGGKNFPKKILLSAEFLSNQSCSYLDRTMSSKELDNLVDLGLLKREPGDQLEFNGLVASGRKRLADANNAELAAESKFDLAYNAAHALALAAMRWHGFRPAGKRYIVFQTLGYTLKIKP